MSIQELSKDVARYLGVIGCWALIAEDGHAILWAVSREALEQDLAEIGVVI